MKQVDWRPEWNVLDIGCGGGANVKRLLKLCPLGKVYGMDLSEESVAFARRHNAGEVDRRCFIRQGDVCSLYLTGTGRSMPLRPSRPSISGRPSARRWPKSSACSGKEAAFSSVWKQATRTRKGVDGADKGNDGVQAEELKRLLSQAGFSDIRVIRKKRRVAYRRT